MRRLRAFTLIEMMAVMVIIMTTILGVFFFGIDSIFSAIVKLLLNLAV